MPAWFNFYQDDLAIAEGTNAALRPLWPTAVADVGRSWAQACDKNKPDREPAGRNRVQQH